MGGLRKNPGAFGPFFMPGRCGRSESYKDTGERMAYTQARQVAALVKRSVLDGVTVSIGKSEQVGGIEVVIRRFDHPEDGLSRRWFIDVLGRSGMELDLVLAGLRKAGFDLQGSAPLMTGVLTQVLTPFELERQKKRREKEEKEKEKVQFKAELQAETLIARQDSRSELEELREEVQRLKEMIEDMALLPQRRGPAGPAGEPGPAGRDGAASDLAAASLSDLGDVSDREPEERQVLTWKEGSWQALYVPTLSGNIYPGGGGGGGGDASISILQRDRGDLGAEPTYLQTGVTKISFDSESGFEAQDLGDGEAFIKLNSTFNPWYVDGEDTLDATGEEPVEFVGGNGVTITTDADSPIKRIIFTADAGGGFTPPTTVSEYPSSYANLVVDLETGEIVAVQPLDVISPE